MTEDRRLLRGYPAPWRDRYGAELLALIEDVSGGQPPSRRVRTSLLVAGLVERLRAQAIIGRDRPPVDRVRAGSRVILVAWAALVVAGCGFAKVAEHWTANVPNGDRLVPSLMYATVVLGAVVGATSLLGVIVVALPSLRRALSAGRLRAARRSVARAVGLSLAAGAATVGLALAARHLSAAQRNGASVIYLVAFGSWVAVIVATITSWAAAALAVERRIDVTPRLARAMNLGSSAVAVCTVVTAGSMLTWWVALARAAPWALGGHAIGQSSSAWAWPLPVVAAVAVVAALVALLGASRLASAARSDVRSPPSA